MSPSFPTPLIPLPQDALQSHPAAITGADESKEDLFATLFSPPTPRASPVPHRAPISVDTAIERRPTHHARLDSADSEFGAFVSVPQTDDPLYAGIPAPEMTPFSPTQNNEFFDRFTEEARIATEKSKRGILDELVMHEDDPLYFLKSETTANGSSAPSSSSPTYTVPATQPELVDLQPSSIPPLSVTEPTLRTTEPETAETEQLTHNVQRKQSRSQVRHHNRSRSPSILRSPSLSPSTLSRLSLPETQIQPTTASSVFTPTSRWVSSLLSSAVRPGLRRNRSSLDETRNDDTYGASVHNSLTKTSSHPSLLSTAGLPSGLPTQLRDSLSSFARQPVGTAASIVQGGVPSTVDSTITHGTPFATHPFVPASGAPGFAGDQEWGKDFEFDKKDVERKSVRLVGRKEITTPVLTVELADMLRPHLPALARLPRAWTLLYSLDQHGISLKTLYTRCQAHTGGALVIMRDSGDTIFGAWMGEGVHPSKGSYYGSGESFLWKLLPDRTLQIYKWTGKNDYVALCEPEYVSFGGGDGNYGLYLDESLIDGSSARCVTFENEPLCSAGPRRGESVQFECVGLEVWGVG